jgi:hypothetical protein
MSNSSISHCLDSLKSIYESSNFYKEARIISFIDHLYLESMDKIKSKLDVKHPTFKEKSKDEIAEDAEFGIKILEKIKTGLSRSCF